jgi:hypothetical protein
MYRPGLGPKFPPGSIIKQGGGAPARGGAIRPMLNFLGRTGLEPGQSYGQSGPEHVAHITDSCIYKLSTGDGC